MPNYGGYGYKLLTAQGMVYRDKGGNDRSKVGFVNEYGTIKDQDRLMQEKMFEKFREDIRNKK